MDETNSYVCLSAVCDTVRVPDLLVIVGTQVGRAIRSGGQVESSTACDVVNCARCRDL